MACAVGASAALDRIGDDGDDVTGPDPESATRGAAVLARAVGRAVRELVDRATMGAGLPRPPADPTGL